MVNDTLFNSINYCDIINFHLYKYLYNDETMIYIGVFDNYENEFYIFFYMMIIIYFDCTNTNIKKKY
jgi:hypothetical protein